MHRTVTLWGGVKLTTKAKMTDVKIPRQAAEALALANKIFGRSLEAAYLYGSAVAGGLRPHSDVDVLLAIHSAMTGNKRHLLTEGLLSISYPPGADGGRPLELSIVTLEALASGEFPPLCEYMYGEWLREEIESGVLPLPHRDPDMTLLLRQARERGVALKGPQPAALIPPQRERDVYCAMKLSLPELLAGFCGDERNVLLTLARMWLTAETGEIASKDEAAAWAMPKLSKEYAGILKSARDSYTGGQGFNTEGRFDAARELAVFMEGTVRKLL